MQMTKFGGAEALMKAIAYMGDEEKMTIVRAGNAIVVVRQNASESFLVDVPTLKNDVEGYFYNGEE